MFTLLFDHLSFPLTAAFYFRDQATRKKKKIVRRLNRMLMNDLEDVKQEDFNRIVDFLPGFIDSMLPLVVFCTYVYFGNKITMAQLVICEEMIRKFNGKIGHIIHRYNDWDHLSTSLQKVHTFYTAFEIQKGIIVK